MASAEDVALRTDTGRGRQRNRTRKRMTKDLKGLALWVAPLAFFILCWDIAVRLELLNQSLLPGPGTVLRALIDLAASGDLWRHTSASLGRGAVGFVIAALVAVPMGIFIGWFRLMDRLVSPLVEVARQLPPLAMFPIFLLFFGIGYESQLAMVFWASAWPIILTTIAGTRNVDPRLVKAARTLGAQRSDLFLRVAIPSCIPYLATGLRLGGSYAFLVLVGAEMIGAREGLGFLLINSQYLFKIPQMYAAIVVLAALGLLLNYLLVLLERRMTRWQQR